jgi:hypothetical protein
MKEGSSESDAKQLFCRMTKGFLSEISEMRPLSSDELNRVLTDPKVSKEICPEGEIVDQSGITLSEDTSASLQPDLRELGEKLETGTPR